MAIKPQKAVKGIFARIISFQKTRLRFLVLLEL